MFNEIVAGAIFFRGPITTATKPTHHNKTSTQAEHVVDGLGPDRDGSQETPTPAAARSPDAIAWLAQRLWWEDRLDHLHVARDARVAATDDASPNGACDRTPGQVVPRPRRAEPETEEQEDDLGDLEERHDNVECTEQSPQDSDLVCAVQPPLSSRCSGQSITRHEQPALSLPRAP
jgi:hypothetical protein